MFCKYCGKEIPDGSSFCQKCGKKLTDAVAASADEAVKTTANETAEAGAAAEAAVVDNAENVSKNAGGTAAKSGKLNKKALLAIVFGAAAILIGLITLIICLASGGKKSGNIIVASGETEIEQIDGEIVIVNNKAEVTKIEFSSGDLDYFSARYDMNLSKAAITAIRRTGNDYDSYDNYYSYDLYYYDGASVKKIIQNSETRVQATISADGSTVVYVKDDDIYLYSNGKSVKIAEDATPTAVSPNGKIIAYYRIASDGDSRKGYYYYNGKEVFLVNSGAAFAIANDAKYVYIYRYGAEGSGDAIFVQKKNNENTRVRLCSTDSISFVILNADLSQILVGSNSGTLLSKNGKEPKKLYDSIIFPIVPEYVAGINDDSSAIGIVDLEKALYKDDDSGLRVLRIVKGQAETILDDIEGGIDDVELSADGKTLFICSDESNEKIYYYRSGSAAAPKLVLDTEEVLRYVISQDAKTMYYCNQYYEVYAKKLDGKPVKIFDGTAETYTSLTVCRNKLYFLSEGKLYCSDGGKAKEVKACDGKIEDIESGNYVLIVVDEQGRTYLSGDGKTFKKVSDNNWLRY